MTLIIRTTGFSDYLALAGGSYIKCLILGEPDSGKTRSASFWPDPVFADCEQGRMSIADRQVPYAEIRTRKDFQALVARVRQECLKAPDDRLFKTFVLDTIDSYQRILIADRLKEERKEALSGWADWGWLGSAMDADLQSVLSLPMHVVVNLHVKDEADGDEDSRTLVKRSKLKGDIKDQIAGQFDLVGYLEKSYAAEGGKRVLQRAIRWHSEPKYPMAKDRSGRLPRYTPVEFSEEDFNIIHTTIVGDHMKDLPETGTFEELETGEVAPAPPDVKGGPVTPDPIPAPRVSAAKKAAAKKKPAPKAKKDDAEETTEESGASSVPQDSEQSEPETQVETRVPTSKGEEAVNTETGEITESDGEAETTEEQAVENVKEGFGGATEVIEAPAEDDGVPRCGDQPKSLQRHAAAKGCGKSLAGENQIRRNMAIARAKTYLCDACFTVWEKTK